jgi:hypothetical protein
LLSIPGWRSERKLVVIESDDWGSIRMPSLETYSKFVKQGYDIAGSDYNKLDSLENNDDLLMLYDVLSGFMDGFGKRPVITANVVVGNPDFNKIKLSEFNKYYFEPVTETLQRYPNRDKVVSLWKQGCQEGLFHPQFHGREHVNVVRWMEALKMGTPEIMFTFENETTFSGDGDYNFMEVLDYNTPKDLEEMKKALTEGLDIFESIFGYRSKSFIPPCYTWNSAVEETLSAGGVRYIQGLPIQSIPTGTFNKYRKKYNYLGRRNKHGQYFLVRNCFFEPSIDKSSDHVGECLNRINIAFRWKKPAIISSHRINFMGSLNEENRTQNLELFRNLLQRILKIWPDVEFVSSDQLGDIISGE